MLLKLLPSGMLVVSTDHGNLSGPPSVTSVSRVQLGTVAMAVTSSTACLVLMETPRVVVGPRCSCVVPLLGSDVKTAGCCFIVVEGTNVGRVGFSLDSDDGNVWKPVVVVIFFLWGTFFFAFCNLIDEVVCLVLQLTCVMEVDISCIEESDVIITYPLVSCVEVEADVVCGAFSVCLPLLEGQNSRS